MLFAQNKNFPSFNLQDTFIYTKDFENKLFSPNHSKIAKNKSFVLSPINHCEKSPLNIHLNDIKNKKINEILPPTKNLKTKTKTLRKINNISDTFDSKKIIDHLTLLENLSKSQSLKYFLPKFHKKTKTNETLTESKEILRNSSIRKSNFPYKINTSTKKNTQEIENNDMSIKKTNGIKSPLKTLTKIRNCFKKSILKPESRWNWIPEYKTFIDIIQKIFLNFTCLSERLTNRNHLAKKLHSFIPTNKKYLEKLFFIGDKLNPIINEKTLENACIIQENSSGITFKYKFIKPNLISDLEDLNNLIEEFNIDIESLEIGYLEENFKESFREIIKLPHKKINSFDFGDFIIQSTNPSTIIDDLLQGEKNFGNFQHISLREKKIGKKLDETFKKIKEFNERDKFQIIL